MKDFFKYLTPGESDKEWGLYLNVVGNANIQPMSPYPSSDHPTGYHYHWDEGRILKEYQINYISEGTGILENDHQQYPIKPGTIMIIRPGVWHRYKPEVSTGWHEYYIGFDGEMARRLLKQSIYASKQPVIYCGYRQEFIDTYLKIYDLVSEESPGFQQVSSGLVIKLLGYIVAYKRQRDFSGKHIERVIQKVRFHMHENTESVIDLPGLAEEHQIAYSHLRKMFKKYTGVSPRQYQLQLKLLRARELILSTDKSVKEIAYELGFSSIYYFSRFFKNKTGVSPTALKRNFRNRKPIDP